MLHPFYHQLQELNARLSFQPLIRLWDELSDRQGYIAGYIKDLSARFSKALQVSEDGLALSEKFPLIIEEALATLFPAALSGQKVLYAVAAPFASKPVFASQYFHDTYLDEIGRFRFPMDEQVQKNLIEAKTHLAYKLILKSCYGIELAGGENFICVYPEKGSSIHNYFQLEWDSRFVDVIADIRLPMLPPGFLDQCHHASSLKNFTNLPSILPLRWFVFEGFVITRIREVSAEQTILNIRNALDHSNPFEQELGMIELKNQLRYLLSLNNESIGFTIFYEAEENEVIHLLNYSSLVLKGLSQDEASLLCAELKHLLPFHSRSYLWDGREGEPENLLDRRLQSAGCCNALFIGFYEQDILIGCMEIQSEKPLLSKDRLYERLAFVEEILGFAVLKYRHTIQAQIDQLVRHHFTPIQPAVAWKFKNAAVICLHKQHHGQGADIESIIFDNVHPHYSVFDIRDSSALRQQSIRDDIESQLKHLVSITDFTGSDKSLIATRIKDSAWKQLSLLQTRYSDEALRNAKQFLLDLKPGWLAELLETYEPYHERVTEYWKLSDNSSGLFQCNQLCFEESVTRLNAYLLGRLEEQDQLLREMYPHYLEKALTDGMEFIVYMGPSIAPHKSFLETHLTELRAWQLRFMVQVARELATFSAELPMPMQSTQLLLAYPETLSIRFRNAERRFDVDDVHHVHFEILRKRIDKAIVSGSGARLTQPGTICIVYSDEKAAAEYRGYIRELQKEKMLKTKVEILQLEALQGLGVLKSLRVEIED